MNTSRINRRLEKVTTKTRFRFQGSNLLVPIRDDVYCDASNGEEIEKRYYLVLRDGSRVNVYPDGQKRPAENPIASEKKRAKLNDSVVVNDTFIPQETMTNVLNAANVESAFTPQISFDENHFYENILNELNQETILISKLQNDLVFFFFASNIAKQVKNLTDRDSPIVISTFKSILQPLQNLTEQERMYLGILNVNAGRVSVAIAMDPTKVRHWLPLVLAKRNPSLQSFTKADVKKDDAEKISQERTKLVQKWKDDERFRSFAYIVTERIRSTCYKDIVKVKFPNNIYELFAGKDDQPGFSDHELKLLGLRDFNKVKTVYVTNNVTIDIEVAREWTQLILEPISLDTDASVAPAGGTEVVAEVNQDVAPTETQIAPNDANEPAQISEDVLANIFGDYGTFFPSIATQHEQAVHETMLDLANLDEYELFMQQYGNSI